MKTQDLKTAQFGTNAYEMTNQLLWKFQKGEITTAEQLESAIAQITNRVRIETLAPFYNALETEAAIIK